MFPYRINFSKKGLDQSLQKCSLAYQLGKQSAPLGKSQSIMIPDKTPSYLAIIIVGKFRPRLIKLTSFKPKLLIIFIMNKP